MKTALRVIVAINMIGAVRAILMLPQLFQVVDVDPSVLNMVVLGTLCVLLPVIVIGGVQLWQFRRSGLILSVLALVVMLSVSVSALVLERAGTMTVVRMAMAVCMLATLLSPRAGTTCQG